MIAHNVQKEKKLTEKRNIKRYEKVKWREKGRKLKEQNQKKGV